MDFFGVRNAPCTLQDQPKNDRTAALHPLSRTKPKKMQNVLSIQGLPDERKAESTHGRGHYTELSAESEELYNPKDLVGSLPRQASIGSGRPVAKSNFLRPQLTIFYKGTMKVYDISAHKAQAIITLAGNIMGSPTADHATAASSRPLSSHSKSALHHMECVDLPFARQQSLQRFLEKRKDRLNSAGPYRRAFISKQLAEDVFSA